MKFLNYTDYTIMALYFMALILIGTILKKRASSDMESYFLAGRKLPWWALGLSNMAAWVDMTGTMIIASFLFMLGPRGLYIEFRGGAGLLLIFCLLWMGKWHRRSGCITGAEWMIFRFGRDSGGHFARLASAISTVIFGIGMLAYSFVGAGLFLSMFFPYPPWICSLALLILTMIYTMEAGFYGVVFTDVFQSVCIWIGVFFIATMAMVKIHHAGNIGAVALAVTGNTDWTSSIPQWHTTMPHGYEAYTSLTMVMCFYLLKTIIQGMGAGADPKYFGAKSDRDCGLLSFFCGWLMSARWLLMIAFVVLGLFLVQDLFPNQQVLQQAAQLIKDNVGHVNKNRWAELLASIVNHPQNYSATLISSLQNLLGMDWASKLSLLSYEGTVDPERIMPAVLMFNIPMGLRGLIMVALLAAAMSTFNAIINFTTGYMTRDIYQAYLRPKAGNRELIYMSYLFSTLLVTAAFIMAYSSNNINDIWGWLMMGLSGGLIAPSFLRFYWWRFNGAGFAAGTCAGIIAAILQRIFSPQMAEWQQFTIITSIGLLASIIGTFAAPPTDSRTLEQFYIRTRPFGLWKQFETLLPVHVFRAMKREHFYDIVSVPFALGWQITVLLLPMQLVIGTYKAFFITLGILIICLAGMYVFWYKNLPAQQDEQLVQIPGNLDSSEKNCIA